MGHRQVSHKRRLPGVTASGCGSLAKAKKRYIAVVVIIAAGSIFALHYCYLDKSYDYKIKEDVTEQFESSEMASVIVGLACTCNESYDQENTRAENYDVYLNCGEYYLSVEDDVISTLNGDEFVLSGKMKSICYFSGYITKEGLRKLKWNHVVTHIESNKAEGYKLL